MNGKDKLKRVIFCSLSYFSRVGNQLVMVISTKQPGYPHSLFLPVFGILKSWRGTAMIHENPETELIRQQGLYIRALEEQLAVCEERNKAQELLIEQLNRMLDLFAGEISRIKAENEKIRKEK